MYRLRALPLPQQTFVALDFPGFDSKHQRVPMTKTKQLLDRLVAVEKLVLRIGAQVMLIKNLKQGRLVNGSVGRVIAFEEIGKSQFEVAKEDNNRKDKDRLLHRVELENAQSTNPEHSQAQATKWPVVQFESGPTLLCVPVSFTVENSAGRVEAQRDQVRVLGTILE
ncbi:uncharacterized protein EI90DRAFT_518524 [Cantharellus anzutake]|uniref:uncharacterized protein n=1 Tax=Cantharellus anzutake TaxID=1750568 RepID=UPI001906C712|nr:uncharacterized protein EI90DRAFT_518524 [Cantharellus anzutake]KAF8334162.1 hypothetical protein EI90DRAFT_518524 [Cantharellus anzutake]